MRRMRSGAMAAMTIAIALALAAGACSSDDDSTVTPAASAGPSENESKAPEDVRVSAAEVSAGLTQIRDLTAQAAQAAGSDKAKAHELHEQIEPVWEHVEGTVKANDSDAYITFEDSFAELGNAIDAGDSAKAQQAATTVATAVTAYLEKYPG
jgi:hypothetical protein